MKNKTEIIGEKELLRDIIDRNHENYITNIVLDYARNLPDEVILAINNVMKNSYNPERKRGAFREKTLESIFKASGPGYGILKDREDVNEWLEDKGFPQLAYWVYQFVYNQKWKIDYAPGGFNDEYGWVVFKPE